MTVQRRWRDEFGLSLADPDRLAGHLDDVERTLQVAPVPLEIMGRNGRLLLEGAAALGWHAAPIPAMRRAVMPAASAQLVVHVTPSSVCTSTRCRRRAPRAPASSAMPASNG
ncbi:hypothetical protein I553_2197 [Mycobacterium xenopi 4042]|uniref:Glucose-methanol-choline oxidoreductase N-terminal domain-containing protein n=1 Tax=Mycobacterium xenopi 4042 TaxID=1299334 RepID=X8DKT3_MYCXE|nr:hypothetical protein I553_2197 [Mycobacterium xenopi 4042]